MFIKCFNKAQNRMVLFCSVLFCSVLFALIVF